VQKLELFVEAGRQLTICNACRYCEGYCPVFRAIESRREFSQGDVLYLAHLCHDCRACFYACMYEPPHEFAINIPQVMSNIRIASYQAWSWPEACARAFADRRIGFALAAFAATAIVVLSVLLVTPSRLFAKEHPVSGFYDVIPYPAMVVPGLALFCYGIAIWVRGGARFWTEMGRALASADRFKAFVRTMLDAFGLPYLKGGGPGCYYPNERPSAIRRICHGLVFWGFLSGLVSTTLAFIYQDVLHLFPPYPLESAPVCFGIICGVSLIAGTGALIFLKAKSDRIPSGEGASTMDLVFILTLGLTAFTGMLILAFRSTVAMGSLLVIHLACVAALFLTAPYGKFVHGVYRFLALLRYNSEDSTHTASTSL